jgi:hypothetical protein
MTLYELIAKETLAENKVESQRITRLAQYRAIALEIEAALGSNLKIADAHNLDQVRLSVPRAREIVNAIKSLRKQENIKPIEPRPEPAWLDQPE